MSNEFLPEETRALIVAWDNYKIAHNNSDRHEFSLTENVIDDNMMDLLGENNIDDDGY